jgi:hypothetical protein
MKRETELTPEERVDHVLFMLMERDIIQYLRANAKGSENSCMKADHHLMLSYIYVASKVGIVDPDLAPRVHNTTHSMMYSKIHDATQELTDFLDEEIGFPLEDPRPNYYHFAPLFFKEFMRHADAEWDSNEINWDDRWNK